MEEYLKQVEDGRCVITLSKVYDGVDTLQMREPMVMDLLSVDMQSKGMSDAMQEITMLANLCDVPPDHIKKLGLKDYKRLQKAFGLFTS